MNDYDVVVIGGGIHGAGVLQAAAAAGYRCLLIERRGLASGTSSRSSKLIHGGLRYLESGQFRLVHESLHERAVMLKVAAELVELKSFYIPVYPTTRRRPWQLRLGLSVYALLGGFHASTRFNIVPRNQWDQLDGLDLRGLQTVIHYFDAQTDDARLTESVVHSACELGAQVALPASMLEAELVADGACVTYSQGNSTRECFTTVLINAAGPWATEVAGLIRPAIQIPRVDLIQGTHIVIPAKITAGIYYVESPGDGRAVFVMPWHGGTMVGTTETAFHGDPDQVKPFAAEEEYLLGVARHYFPNLAAFTRANIIERFAGLRVLPAASADAFGRSRETMFALDRKTKPRVIGIYGGKLTAWRATAAQTLKKARTSLPRPRQNVHTEALILRRTR